MSRLSLKKEDISPFPFFRALLEVLINTKELFVGGANIGKPGGLAYAPEDSPELYPVTLTRWVSLSATALWNYNCLQRVLSSSHSL